jgi:TonB family protein
MVPGTVVTRPTSADAAHDCLDFYPTVDKRLEHQGATTLGYRITTGGTVTGISVLQSSGYVGLDRAAVECAGTWRYHPAMANGAPVEVPWRVKIDWAIPELDPAFRRYIAASNDCALKPPPSQDDLDKAHGRTELEVRVSPRNNPNVAVKTSSGNADLDQRALKCFSVGSKDLSETLVYSEDSVVPVIWK